MGKEIYLELIIKSNRIVSDKFVVLMNLGS